jgi:3-oxoacyl-[acyl-carrier protein] reductase
VVTGGATGIGRAVCQALAAKGMRVGIVFHSSESAARALSEQLPRAFVARADLADPTQVDALVKQLQEVAGRVDVLVNNAGANRDAPIFSMKLDDYDAVAGLGRGTWYLTKLVLRRFMLRSGGRIINISSVVGHTGNAGQIPYTMVKAGLDAMTRSLAQELRGREILVNSVAPGFIDTEMTAGLPDEVKTRILDQIPLGRMGRPEEVAEVVAFLAEAGSYVTGSVIHVNGGLYGG